MRVLYISNANAMAGASLALLHIVHAHGEQELADNRALLEDGLRQIEEGRKTLSESTATLAESRLTLAVILRGALSYRSCKLYHNRNKRHRNKSKPYIRGYHKYEGADKAYNTAYNRGQRVIQHNVDIIYIVCKSAHYLACGI